MCVSELGGKQVQNQLATFPPFSPPLKIVFLSFCKSLWLICHMMWLRNCRRNKLSTAQKVKNITERCKKKLKRTAATCHAGPIAFVGFRHNLAAVENRFAVLRVPLSLCVSTPGMPMPARSCPYCSLMPCSHATLACSSFPALTGWDTLRCNGRCLSSSSIIIPSSFSMFGSREW